MGDNFTDNISCGTFGVAPGTFPCDANPVQAISMGLFTGAIALIFSVLLMKKVCRQMFIIRMQGSFSNR